MPNDSTSPVPSSDISIVLLPKTSQHKNKRNDLFYQSHIDYIMVLVTNDDSGEIDNTVLSLLRINFEPTVIKHLGLDEPDTIMLPL